MCHECKTGWNACRNFVLHAYTGMDPSVLGSDYVIEDYASTLPACDCGAEKCRTIYVYWCSKNV